MSKMLNANFPMDKDGRTYHVGLKIGEVSNLVLMVGDHKRATLLKCLLSNSMSFDSSRGFLAYTGFYQGRQITILSIGMGFPMADFAIRELRAVVLGPLYVIRLGTCGTPSASFGLGSVIAAKQSFAITTNFDAYHQNIALNKFVFSSPIAADPLMHEALLKNLRERVPKNYTVAEAFDATADSFYSSQGRLDHSFKDDNHELLFEIMTRYPMTGSLQMETFQIYHLARIGKDIRAAAAAIVVADRHRDSFLSKEELIILEMHAGEACLNALIEFSHS